MKTYLLAALAMILGSIPVMAQQGTFFFNNVNAPSGGSNGISIATGTDSASLAAATLIGTNAVSESLGAGPGQVNIELYIALNGTVPQYLSGPGLPPSNFFLAGTTTNVGLTGGPSTLQGKFNGGGPYPIPSDLDGGAFTVNTQVEYQFFAITQNGYFAGLSALGTDCILGGGPQLPTPAFGTDPGEIGGWTLTPIPEPSMAISSILSAAVLFLCRGRK